MEPISQIENLTHTYSAGTPLQRSAEEGVGSAGGRRGSELVALPVNCVNFEKRQILVFGKGAKERLVPAAVAGGSGGGGVAGRGPTLHLRRPHCRTGRFSVPHLLGSQFAVYLLLQPVADALLRGRSLYRDLPDTGWGTVEISLTFSMQYYT